MGREDWLKREHAHKAVEALQKHFADVQSRKKQSLLGEDGYVYLVASFKTVQQSRSAPKKIPLPHPIINPSTVTVCLFSKDPKLKVKTLLNANGIDFVTKVVSLKKLRSDFKTHERRRVLASMYDIFLADHRILPILYNKLGKAFIQRKGFPYLVNLTKRDVKAELLTVLSSTHYRISEGKTLSVKIGRVSMTSEEILDNLVATVMGVVQRVPKGWHNVHSLNIKTADSTSLPVYNSMTVEPLKIAV